LIYKICLFPTPTAHRLAVERLKNSLQFRPSEHQTEPYGSIRSRSALTVLVC
jgi:hypothetical protein